MLHIGISNVSSSSNDGDFPVQLLVKLTPTTDVLDFVKNIAKIYRKGTDQDVSRLFDPVPAKVFTKSLYTDNGVKALVGARQFFKINKEVKPSLFINGNVISFIIIKNQNANFNLSDQILRAIHGANGGMQLSVASTSSGASAAVEDLFQHERLIKGIEEVAGGKKNVIMSAIKQSKSSTFISPGY